MGEYTRMIDAILEHFGLDPYESRLDKDNWIIFRGTVGVLVTVIEPKSEEDGGFFAVNSPIVRLPKQNLAPMYRFMLEKNFADTRQARFAINDDVVSVVCIRSVTDLDPVEAASIIDDVSGVADEYDVFLIREFGATKYEPKE